MNRTRALSLLAISLGIISTGAAAQSPNPAAPPASASDREAPWTGLPFSSLADYESKVPVGMTRDALVGLLGQPEQIMPGHEQDQVYFYGYSLTDHRELTAVIVVRDGAVFIRRLYATTPSASATRAN